MISITRRAAIGGLASAAVALPAAASTGEIPRLGTGYDSQFNGGYIIHRAENPELLKLGRDLRQASAVALQADEAVRAAVARFDAMPLGIPDDLILNDNPALRFCGGQLKQDAFGRSIPGSPLIITAWDLKEAAMRFPEADLYPGDEIRRLLPIAKAYEAALEEVRDRAGVQAAVNAWWDADRAVREICSAIVTTAAQTLVGLAIKAEAMVAQAAMLHRQQRIEPGEAMLDLERTLNALT